MPDNPNVDRGDLGCEKLFPGREIHVLDPALEPSVLQYCTSLLKREHGPLHCHFQKPDPALFGAQGFSLRRHLPICAFDFCSELINSSEEAKVSLELGRCDRSQSTGGSFGCIVRNKQVALPQYHLVSRSLLNLLNPHGHRLAVMQQGHSTLRKT